MGKIGKMDFVRSVAGKIAREAGQSGAQATEAKARAVPIAAPMVPFEKRVLMDAVLEWDIGGLEQTTTFLSGLHNLISAQVDGYSDFLDDFNTLAEGALTTVEVLGALNESNDNDNQDQLAEMIERMGAALTQLKEGSLTALSSIFTPEGAAPIDFDGEIADLLETALIGFADDEGAFAGMTASERTTAEGTIRTAVTDARVAATFNLAAFTSNTVTEKVEALSVTLAAALTDLGLVAEDIAGKITEVGDDYFNGLLGAGLAVNLDDITVTVGGAVINLVTFTQGADNSTVNVAVHLPSFAFDLDSLLDMANAGISLPISLTDDSSAESLTFTLSSIIEKTGAVVDAVGLDITDFDFAPLFELGGPIDMTGIDASVNLGLLTAEITDIAVAQIRATITVDPDLNLGGQFNLTGDVGIESFATDLDIGVMVEVDAIEAEGETDEGFVEVVEDAEYTMLKVDLGGVLSFFSDADADADADSSYGYAAAVTVSTVLNNSLSTTPAETVANFLRDARIGFEADLSASVADEDLRDALEQTVEALVGLGVDQITGFLASVGDLVADVLDAVLGGVEIPFTDFEITSVVDEINGFFTGLADAFVISSEDLGYAYGAPTTETMTPALDTQSVEEFDFAALSETLAGYDSITFVIIERDAAANTTAIDGDEIVIDLAGDAVWADADASDEDRLGALIALLNDGLEAFGFEFALVDGALQVVADTTGNPGRSFAILGAMPKPEEVDPPADGEEPAEPVEPVFDTTFGLADLGFSVTTFDAEGVVTEDGNGVELEGLTDDAADKMLVLNFTAATDTSFTPGDKFDEAMVGVEGLRYLAVVDGEEIEVVVETPEDGWYDPLTGAPNLEGMIEAFNAALEDAGVAIEAVLNADEDGIDFALTEDAEGPINFGIDPEKLTRAFDLDTLIEWVNVRLNDAQLLDGSQLKLTAEGKLMFVFPSMETSVDVGTDEAVGFDTADLVGTDALGKLALSAKLTAALNAKFDVSIGIDLLGFAADLIGDVAAGEEPESVLEAKDNQEEAEKEAAEDGATADDGPSFLDMVLENVFFGDFALSVDVTGVATGITGTADIGLMAAVVGRNDADANFITLNAQMDVTLVGQRGGDDFGNEVSLQNLIDAVTYKDPITLEYDGLRGLNGLIGRTDFQGGIVTDGDGNALDADGEAVETAAAVRIENADEYELLDGEVLSMLHVYLGDISLDAAGVAGLNEGFVDGVSIVVGNLSHPIDTLSYALIGDGAESIEALANLGQGDILDSFATIANMLSVLGGALKEKLPFLDEDIPLLNFSLLDAVDFSKDFAEALKDFRDNPSAGLAQADQFLEQYFGDETITLTWDADAKTLKFKLSLEFLKDYSEEIAFNFDLDAILGDALKDILGDGAGEIAADLISGFADVGGDGKLVFDPDLTLDLSFGIDLSATLVDLTVLAAEETLLSELSTVGSINQADVGTADLQIRWRDTTDAANIENKVVRVDIDGAETLADLVAKINDAVVAEFGATVSFSYDADTGQVTLFDSNSDLTDNTNVNTLFGSTLEGADFVRSEPAAEAEVDDPGTDEDESAAYIPQIIALAEDFADFAAEYAITLAFGPEADAEFAETILLELAADAARDTAEKFAAAINAALAALDVPRSAINGNSVDGWTVAADHLIVASVADGVITLTTTNFSDAIGADPFAFGVGGTDISHDVTFTMTELNGSNALRALGFDSFGVQIVGTVVSEALYQGVDIGAPRVYLDTAESGIMLTMVAGAPEGLNLKLGLGPLSVNVVDGSAQLTAGAGETGPAFLGISFIDVDSDTFEDQYDLSDLFNIATDDSRSFADVLALDVGIGINVDLGFSDSLGIMDPAEHGVSYTTDLITTSGPVSLATLIDEGFEAFSGDLINIYNGDALEGEFELNLPDLSEMLSNFNILALLNNPRLVLDGLDLILDQMQSLFDEYLSDIDLPVVGDTIGSAVTFFNDFRYNIIEKARVIAETPMDNGELPTTVDLITGWVNDQLNELFNPDGDPITFIQMFLNTEGGMTDSYLYGSINFSAEIFREKLDIALDLGIPGFEIEVNEGSEVELALGYSVNIGFGADKNGFFLLNDTTAKEIAIEFKADAGSLQGSAKLLGLLGITADAVTIGSDGGLNGVGTTDGTLEVTASLGVNLYGDDGMDIVDGTAGADEVAMDLSGIDLKNGLGESLEFEKAVYLSKIDYDQLVSFTFNAAVDIQIALEANVIDPSSGDPLLIGGAAVIPSVLTEIVFQGMYDSGEHDLGFQIEKLAFQDVRMDMSVLYTAIIQPVLDPIMEFIRPILPLISWMNEAPFSYLVDLLGKAFPIFGIALSVVRTIDDIANFVDQLEATDGMFVFGTFDFTEAMQDGGEVEATQADRKTTGASSTTGTGGNPFGVFGNTASGFSIEIPLLTDPMSALNILTGEFDKVDLIEVTFTLMNLNFPRTSIVEMLLDAIDAPGWVNDIISGILKAEIEARLIAKITAGYDMGGIVNFINTWDPVRLLDGVYLDSSQHLLDVFFGIWIELNAGVAGLEGSAYGGVTLDFNDPNDDGKLRIPELLMMLDVDDPADILGNVFKGEVVYGAALSFWAGIRLPWPLPDLIWETDLFDVSGSIQFGGNDIGAQISQEVDAGETAILNIGARAGGNMTSLDEDGDDVVTLDGPNSPIQVSLVTNQGSTSGSFNQDAGGVIIPAGEGNNTIDLSQLTNGIPTVTYTGSGKDTIILPNAGLNVVFAGDGIDTITQTGASTGTYVIFGGGGADKVTIESGNVIYFGDADFGMRDRFLAAFANGGLTNAAMLSMLGLNADGTVGSGGTYTSTAGGNLTLTALLDQYTALTQLSAENKAETVSVGGGNHVILTGRAVDNITVSGSIGNVRVYSGDGADVLNVGGANLYVEAGAGSDRIFTSAGTAEVWGWGKQAGTEGSLGTNAGQEIDALAQRDGADLMIGGAGHDKFYGQIGKDIIEGNGGNDTGVGGLGVDLITGGTFDIKTAAGAAVVIANMNPATGFGTGITVSALDAADGHDSLSGGLGADILLGGGGNDTIDGGANADAIVGDFALIGLSTNLVAESIRTQYDASPNSGTDNLTGGQGNDILIAGGSAPGESETVTDTEGSNVIIGDFGTAAGSRLSEAVTLVQSTASAQGGADSITTGRGNDMILGGEGGDTIIAGRGGDIVLGDLGTIDITARTITGVADANSGNDSITFDGTGQDITDIAIAGLGDDTIAAGKGGLLLLGDDGQIIVDPVALAALRAYEPVGSSYPDAAALAQAQADDLAAREKIAKLAKELVSANSATDGADVVTINNGGYLRAVMGGGDDAVTLSTGESYVLADDGTLTILSGKDADDNPISGVEMVAAVSLNAGDDTVTSSSAADMILGGAGDDSIDTGTGDDIVLGDMGQMKRETVLEVTTNTVTADTTIAGDDTVLGGAGAKTVLLGQGDDVATLGNTGSLVLGDTGAATMVGGEWTASTSQSIGGNDSITTGSGDDIILAGIGDDTVDAGNGDNLILGDTGSWAADVLTSASDAADGDDTVTAGTGLDRVILGGGADHANLSSGDNRVIGDSGVNNWTTAASELLEVSDILIGGSDTITTTAGNDIILGAAGGDSIVAGNGDNLILGDAGSWTPSILTSTSNTADGDDTVTAGTGLDRVILGGGADIADLSSGDNRVIGDSGVNNWTTAASELLEVSDILIGGSDTITTTAGNDIILGAAGGDSIAAGHGDNLILGDAGSWTPMVLTSASNTADGDDTVTAGTGLDRVILGGGADHANLSSGDNRVIGDSGVNNWTTAASELLEVSDILIGGSDTITTTAGNDIILGAAGGDSIKAGNGDNLILGDAGSWTPMVLTSASNTADGDDTVTAGTGLDRVILGGGADIANLSSGDNRVIGDSGVVTYGATETAEVTDNAIGGSDTITTTAGDDIIIGAAGGDIIKAGNGDNLILGDTGRVVIDATDRNSMVGEDSDNGGADSITSGSGRDAIIGGLAGDMITSGAGDDAILGDLGRFTEAQGTSNGTLQSLASAPTVGDDSITAGSGDDMVIAGLGDDTVLAGIGEDLVMGDQANVTFAGTSDIATLIAQNLDLGGSDSIVTAGASGDDIVMGQSGADSIKAAGGDDLIIADLAEVDLSAPRDALVGQSAADRLLRADGIRPDLGFDDTIMGGAGGDIIIAGFGADSINGQSGQDFIIADSVTFLRKWIELADGSIQEDIDLETNFAYLTGGLDSVRGGTGYDVMIGGLGGDVFFGNTAEDALFSDGYAGLFKATFINGFLTSPLPHRALYTSNFAGPGAVDVVSEAQQNGAIGSPLDLLAAEQQAAEAQQAAAQEQANTEINQVQLAAIFEVLGSQEVLQAVAELLTAGASTGLISEALQNYLYSSGVLSSEINPVQLELIMNVIVTQLTKTALGDAANQDLGAMKLAAE